LLEGAIEPVAHLIANDPADTDPSWLGQSFEPRRDINTVAEDVVLLHHYIAKVDADPKLDLLIYWDSRIALGHPLLDLSRAAHRIYSSATSL
jgi:hypothetical protein